MDNKVLICIDSNGDMTEELAAKYGIVVEPAYVILGTDYLRDGVDVDSKGVFEYVKNNGKLPKTAALVPEDYKALWQPYLDQGYEIVHFTISNDMSACYRNACAAAEEIGNGHVFPVDTMNLSTGMSQLAIEAAIRAKQGMSAKEIFDYAEQKKLKLNVSFIIDTMEFLAKGGRCSSVIALAAGIIKLKPVIEVTGGKMVVAKKYRGKYSQVLKTYVRERLQAAGDVDPSRIFVTHSIDDEALLNEVRAIIEEEKHFDEIIFTYVGCSVASHCGPGTLGLLFFGA